jgi:hypothetical protein
MCVWIAPTPHARAVLEGAGGGRRREVKVVDPVPGASGALAGVCNY